MKHILFIFLIVLFYGLFASVKAQNCKVLAPKIDSIYTGKCKNGFANGKGIAMGEDKYEGKFYKGWPSGKGIYTWANGNSYTGDWKEGKRHGEGILTMKLADRDSILSGLWEEDIYKGPKPKAPKVTYKYQIERYSFRKSGDIKNRVLVNFLQNGNRNITVTNLKMDASNGTETKLGNSLGFEHINFPVTIRISYETMNKLQTLKYNSIIEFEITEPGDWVVDIFN